MNKKLRGGGVSACAVCDGFFYKGQEVAIVGGGDTAAEEATYLANICSKVTMLVRKDKMRASKAMQHRVTNTPNIDLKYNHEIDEVLGDQVVEGLRIFNNKTGEKEEINITGLFIAIGHQPNTEIFNGQLDMDDEGYLITKGKSTKTNIPGVFASGDVQDKEYRQAVTAAGTGCMAAPRMQNAIYKHFKSIIFLWVLSLKMSQGLILKPIHYINGMDNIFHSLSTYSVLPNEGSNNMDISSQQ